MPLYSRNEQTANKDDGETHYDFRHRGIDEFLKFYFSRLFFCSSYALSFGALSLQFSLSLLLDFFLPCSLALRCLLGEGVPFSPVLQRFRWKGTAQDFSPVLNSKY